MLFSAHLNYNVSNMSNMMNALLLFRVYIIQIDFSCQNAVK